MPDFSPQKEKPEEKTTRVLCHVLETSEVGSRRYRLVVNNEKDQ